MSTLREEVSRVRSLNRLLSGDAKITDRVIAAELKSTANQLIKREVDKRKLWSSSNIFTTIPCVSFKSVPISECCEFISNKKVAKSKIKLPKIGEGNYGFLIQGIYSVEISRKLIEVTPSRYINLVKLGLPQATLNVYYWIQNGYLYISDDKVKVVNISAYFEEDVPSSLLYPEEDCKCGPNQNKIEDKCANPLDLEFKCPGYLIPDVQARTLQTLLTTYFRVPEDHTSDNKDDQVNPQV